MVGWAYVTQAYKRAEKPLLARRKKARELLTHSLPQSTGDHTSAARKATQAEASLASNRGQNYDGDRFRWRSPDSAVARAPFVSPFRTCTLEKSHSRPPPSTALRVPFDTFFPPAYTFWFAAARLEWWTQMTCSGSRSDVVSRFDMVPRLHACCVSEEATLSSLHAAATCWRKRRQSPGKQTDQAPPPLLFLGPSHDFGAGQQKASGAAHPQGEPAVAFIPLRCPVQ
ncbi:hypothetical protein MTO96_016701 [Rhipicephalus appendiculatus]